MSCSDFLAQKGKNMKTTQWIFALSFLLGTQTFAQSPGLGHPKPPEFRWLPGTPRGFYQCTAFNESLSAYAAIGRDAQTATYSAMYRCGGRDAQERGCYIPAGYCQYRY